MLVAKISRLLHRPHRNPLMCMKCVAGPLAHSRPALPIAQSYIPHTATSGLHISPSVCAHRTARPCGTAGEMRRQAGNRICHIHLLGPAYPPSVCLHSTARPFGIAERCRARRAICSYHRQLTFDINISPSVCLHSTARPFGIAERCRARRAIVVTTNSCLVACISPPRFACIAPRAPWHSRKMRRHARNGIYHIQLLVVCISPPRVACIAPRAPLAHNMTALPIVQSCIPHKTTIRHLYLPLALHTQHHGPFWHSRRDAAPRAQSYEPQAATNRHQYLLLGLHA